ncbi:MAG: ABC transporter permease [Anaerolineae bacterium]|nr:ABC transporter permease [Anaerolineae bacterium]
MIFSWISRPILLSIRNTFRQKGRLTLTIFTLTIAGAIFIAVFNVRDSMENMMDLLMAHFIADVSVSFPNPILFPASNRCSCRSPALWMSRAGEPPEATSGMKMTRSSQTSTLSPPPADTQLLRVDMISGRWVEPGEENAMVMADSILEDFPDLEPGDSLRVKLPGQPDKDWEVVGIFRFVSMVGFPLAYADFDFISNQTNMQGQAVSYRIVTEDHSMAGQILVKNFVDEYLKKPRVQRRGQCRGFANPGGQRSGN